MANLGSIVLLISQNSSSQKTEIYQLSSIFSHTYPILISTVSPLLTNTFQARRNLQESVNWLENMYKKIITSLDQMFPSFWEVENLSVKLTKIRQLEKGSQFRVQLCFE